MTGVRVLVNLCAVVPGQVGGSEEYSTRLLSAVGVAAPRPGRAAQIELAAMAGVRSAHPELDGCVWHEAPWSGRHRPLRVTVESTWLAWRSAGFDVVHHFGGRLPAVRRGAAVLTIHDVQPLDMAQNFTVLKRRYLRMALRGSARAAAVVTVPSQWTARRVVERLGVAPERVRVVPSTYATAHAVEADAAPGKRGVCGASRPVAAPDSAAGGRAEPWGDGPFVLYPAASYPHKNHAVLIAAHRAARAQGEDLTLVLTGGAGRARAEVAELVARTDGVVHLGRVDAGRLASLMSRAAAVAFPSRYEGFGLPVLEAMAAGTPVIAADATALPELVGDAGTLVGADDIEGWVEAMREAGSGSPEVRRRAQRGLARAADFAPERVAARLVDAWWAAAERVE